MKQMKIHLKRVKERGVLRQGGPKALIGLRRKFDVCMEINVFCQKYVIVLHVQYMNMIVTSILK